MQQKGMLKKIFEKIYIDKTKRIIGYIQYQNRDTTIQYKMLYQ